MCAARLRLTYGPFAYAAPPGANDAWSGVRWGDRSVVARCVAGVVPYTGIIRATDHHHVYEGDQQTYGLATIAGDKIGGTMLESNPDNLSIVNACPIVDAKGSCDIARHGLLTRHNAPKQRTVGQTAPTVDLRVQGHSTNGYEHGYKHGYEHGFLPARLPTQSIRPSKLYEYAAIVASTSRACGRRSPS